MRPDNIWARERRAMCAMRMLYFKWLIRRKQNKKYQTKFNGLRLWLALVVVCVRVRCAYYNFACTYVSPNSVKECISYVQCSWVRPHRHSPPPYLSIQCIYTCDGIILFIDVCMNMLCPQCRRRRRRRHYTQFSVCRLFVVNRNRIRAHVY